MGEAQIFSEAVYLCSQPIRRTMTLQDLFDLVAENPKYVVFYFAILPLAALLAGALDNDRGHALPWNYIYSFLIYAVSVPGLFALTLNVYQFLFERTRVMDVDLVLQVLPIVSMIFTLLIIRRNVDLDYIPGFDKLSGLMMIITAVLGLMWLADRTHIIAFLRLRWQVVILIFAGLMLLIRFGFQRSFGSPYRSRK